MVDILDQSGEKYWFMDEQGSICCGRPLQLAGRVLQAKELMLSNIKLIAASGARTLVHRCARRKRRHVDTIGRDDGQRRRSIRADGGARRNTAAAEGALRARRLAEHRRRQPLPGRRGFAAPVAGSGVRERRRQLQS